MEKLCLNCGKVIPNRNKYCNNTCQNAYEHILFIERWKEGKELGMKGSDGISTHIRSYLFEKYNNKCQRCNWGIKNEFTDKYPLTVHHIDGNCKNNSEENLELLCPNCHSLTETYGASNKNSTREYRYSKK